VNKLRTSKYLQVIPREKDYAIYHSLFGNLCLLDFDGYNLLRVFDKACSSNEVLKSFSKYDPILLIHFINTLLSKGFLTIDGFDEYVLIEEDYQRCKKHFHSGYLIRALQLVMTNKCNRSCEYCFVKTMYNSEERAILEQSPKNVNMSFETAGMAVERLIEILRKNGNRELYIEFFGGEPLLNWQVIKSVLETFKNQANGVTLHYSITTNGSLMIPEMADIFKKYNVTVTMSIDPLDLKEQTACRKGNGRLAQVIRILKEAGNWVTFNSVISEETMDEFDGYTLVEKAKDYNVTMIGLILDLDLAFYGSDNKREAALQKLWETYSFGRQKGIAVVGYWYQIFQQIIGKQATRFSSGYKTCPATGCKLSIEPEGHVFICKCCSTYIGHITDLDMVLHSPQYEAYALKAYYNAPECKGCEVEGFCSGVCMGALEKKYNKIDTIESGTCTIYKKITRKLIENIRTHEILTLPLVQHERKQLHVCG